MRIFSFIPIHMTLNIHQHVSEVLHCMVNHNKYGFIICLGGLCQIRLVQAGYDGNDQHFRRMWPRTKDLIRFPVNIKPPDMYSFRDFLLGRARLLENNPDHIKVGVECLDKV